MLPVRLGSLTGYVASEYVYVAEIAQSTPTPEPTGTPEPTAVPAQGTAMVTAPSGLKLRGGPDTEYASVTTMPYGATVSLLGDMQNGFYPVRYGQTEGYASADYLAVNAQSTPIAIPTATPTPAPTAVPEQGGQSRRGTVSAPSGLNLRAQPGAGAQVLATLGYGVEVTVTGGVTNGFYPVTVGTLSGYVSADYIRFAESAATPTPLVQLITPPPSDGSAYRVVVESGNGLNLRAQPSSSGEVLYELPDGMVLTVLGESENGYLHVTWANYEGYVSGDYVTPFGT